VGARFDLKYLLNVVSLPKEGVRPVRSVFSVPRWFLSRVGLLENAALSRW
jgi:hypothetical protein